MAQLPKLLMRRFIGGIEAVIKAEVPRGNNAVRRPKQSESILEALFQVESMVTRLLRWGEVHAEVDEATCQRNSL